MDSVERGENFSSPRGNPCISSIRKRAIGPFDRIELSDGSFFLIHSRFPPSFSCYTGREILPAELDHLKEISESGSIWEKSLSLLARRNHGRSELKIKLLQKGFSEAVSEMVLDQLSELGYLDDEKFAEEWLSSRLRRHPEGWYSLKAGLLKKGVSRECCESVLTRLFSDEVAQDAAERAFKKALRSGKSEEQMKNFLRKRGFRTHIITRILHPE